ncbi:MAG TPA: patatin family protein [Polyangiaceae bacterium]|nr:patatin family protein [Polyangiaceae bacterium]
MAQKERTAIVVEGGAMRGVFAVGALDLFMERGFHPFDLAIGVSAGACNLASHLAGQEGRNRRAYFELMTTRRFIDPWRALRGGSVVDLDWLWDSLAQRDPLNVERVLGNPTEFVVVGTSSSTGRAVYLRPDAANMFDVLKASCALPMLYRGTITLSGDGVIDGGVADPIPVEEAYRRGARRILVVRSRPASYVKKPRLENHLVGAMLRHRPKLIEAVHGSPAQYRRAVEFIHSPPKDCTILQLAPSDMLATTRTTRDTAKLKLDYELGRKLALDVVERWSA